MRVLVVDDDPDQAIIRCMLLSHYGFDTCRACDPSEAMRSVEESAPGVVIVDLGLPSEEDGLLLVRLLKAQYPAIHIIVFTGMDVGRLRRMPELTEVADVIQKGSSIRTLVQSLAKISAAQAP